jgi:hypothetical protein
VSDSSRYFVLRISDGKGKFAVIGLGFNKRDEAFDFKVALQDASRQMQPEAQVAEEESLDLAIPEGGMIRVEMGAAKKKKKKESVDDEDDEGGFSLAPPKEEKKKKSKEKKEKKSKKSKAAAEGGDEWVNASDNNMGFDDAAFGDANFGDASAFGDANFGDANFGPAAPAATSAAASSSVDLLDFMGMGLDGSPQKPQQAQQPPSALSDWSF